MSFEKPTTAKTFTSSIVRGVVSAEPTTSARTLADKNLHQAKIIASYHVMLPSKDTINEELLLKFQRILLFYQVNVKKNYRMDPGTLSELQFDEKGPFQRAIVVLNPKFFKGTKHFRF